MIEVINKIISELSQNYTQKLPVVQFSFVNWSCLIRPKYSAWNELKNFIFRNLTFQTECVALIQFTFYFCDPCLRHIDI